MGWMGITGPANATENNSRGNRQWDGKRSGRKQYYLQWDRGRGDNINQEQERPGNRGRKRSISRFPVCGFVPFPYRPHFPVPTFTARVPAEFSAAAGVEPAVKAKALRRKVQSSVFSTGIGGEGRHGHGTGTGNGVIYSVPDRDFPEVRVLGFSFHRLPSRRMVSFVHVPRVLPSPYLSVSFRAVFRPVALAVVPIPTRRPSTVSPIPHLNTQYALDWGSKFQISSLFSTESLVFSPYNHHTDASDGYCNQLFCSDATTQRRLLDIWSLQHIISLYMMFSPPFKINCGKLFCCISCFTHRKQKVKDRNESKERVGRYWIKMSKIRCPKL